MISLVAGVFGMIFVTYWLDSSFVFALICLMMMFCFLCLDGVSYVGLSWCFGGDLMSVGMMIISFWVIGLMYLSGGYYGGMYDCFYKVVVVVLLFLLLLSFMVMDLFLFYVSFESVLIPTLILIVGWGYQPERLRAGLYMLFYTLVASLPLLLCLLYLYNYFGSVCYFILMDLSIGGWWVVALFMAFLVKLPMYFLHLWLPRAHVEAPVAGSMILAGVLLKLGGYGLFRIFLLARYWIIYNCDYLMSLGLMGGLIVGFVCVGQVDMKMLVAYSSVVHMSLVMGGVLVGNFLGGWGGFVMMLAHGLCSSCLFCLVNVLYERFHSRSVVIISGVLIIFPSLGLWWFLVCVCNMSAPPSFGLVGEMMLLVGLIGYDFIMMLPLCGISFISAVFSLYLYNVVQHGKSWLVWYGCDVVVREYLLFFFHWVPLNLMFVDMNMWGE
uniref:NADH-ubiquinone oxidoreductase chain 4 n=1 Tax=Pseudocellus gertschi TaxID=1329481 RepID=W5R4D7_9ARAC|nr:NADH dehydrogenase subunit 4 [Pseudocellus gertschi]AGL11940.1 NADH dehydrogenase subunit 4 [Pseudocellus gertschi]